jgi:two-component system chemotaxis response regulator CheY
MVKDKVLIVDDSLTIRQLVAEALEAEGFETLDACDGNEALLRLTERPDIALVMCDVNMPGMSGLDLVAKVRKRGSDVQFVMLTTEGQPELMDRARGLGVKGWMLKPVKPHLLAGAVRSLLSVTPPGSSQAPSTPSGIPGARRRPTHSPTRTQ